MINFKSYWKLLLMISFVVGGCQDFLSVDPPISKIPADMVFADDAAATTAMFGIYITLYDRESFAGGAGPSVMSLTGLSSDELINKPAKDILYTQFQHNDLVSNNVNVLSLWSSMYKTIYQVNSLMEGLSSSKNVSSSTKDQLRGEALFVRAFTYFYLVNLFGDVPLITTIDYNANAVLPRNPKADVLQQIRADLTEAGSLLQSEYLTTERYRPNKFAVLALEARFYLYVEEWARAEDKATQLILQSGLYNLETIERVFRTNSIEAIWQLKPLGTKTATNEGGIFSVSIGPELNVLNSDVASSFEEGDKRYNKWVVHLEDGSGIYLPGKYSSQLSTAPPEFSMVLRLAEQYLIRAEARVRQEKITGAISDIDKIRDRAGLPLIQTANPGINSSALLDLIIHERRIELMAEWGHRWLDLKRLGIAKDVLEPVKNGWDDTDVVYPIPSTELQKNPNLNPQNSGY